MKRQSEIWQGLRYKDAQTRIIDRQSALERIDRENRSLRRKPKNCLDAGSGLHVGRYLGEKRLEKIIFKDFRRIGEGATRKPLSAAKRIAGGSRKNPIQASRINDPKSLGPSLLVADKSLKSVLSERIKRETVEADASCYGRIKEYVRLDAGAIIE